MKLERAFFRPKGLEPAVSIPEHGIEVYVMADGRTAMCFAGKRSKPDIHCRYRDAQRRNDAVQEWIDDIKQRAADKAGDRAAAREWQHGIKVGDVFRCSWGYDQTNIDYFEVVAVRGKSVDVLELQQQIETTGYLCGRCVPIPGKYREKPDYQSDESKRHKEERGYYLSRVPAPRRMIPQRSYKGEPSLSIHSFASAYPVKPTEADGIKIFASSYWSAYA